MTLWTLEFPAPTAGNASLHASRHGLTASQAGRMGWEASGPYEAVTALRDELAGEDRDRRREAVRQAWQEYEQVPADSSRQEAWQRAVRAVEAANAECDRAIAGKYILTRR